MEKCWDGMDKKPATITGDCMCFFVRIFPAFPKLRPTTGTKTGSVHWHFMFTTGRTLSLLSFLMVLVVCCKGMDVLWLSYLFVIGLFYWEVSGHLVKHGSRLASRKWNACYDQAQATKDGGPVKGIHEKKHRFFQTLPQQNCSSTDI